MARSTQPPATKPSQRPQQFKSDAVNGLKIVLPLGVAAFIASVVILQGDATSLGGAVVCTLLPATRWRLLRVGRES